MQTLKQPRDSMITNAPSNIMPILTTSISKVHINAYCHLNRGLKGRCLPHDFPVKMLGNKLVN